MRAGIRRLRTSWPIRAAVMPLLTVALGMWAVVTLVGGVEFRALDQRIKNGDPGKLKTPVLAQSFVSEHDNLSRIELELTQPYTQAVPIDMDAWLGRGEGPDSLDIGGSEIGVARVISEAGVSYLSASFPPISDSGGVTYTFMLLTPGYSVNSILAPAWSTEDALSSGAMYTEDGRQGGDLALSAYYRYSLWSMLGDIWSAVAGRLPTLLVWLLVLLLPGMALLLWLPNGLSMGQRLLAAPALSALLLPILYLVASLVNFTIGQDKLWVFLVVCGIAVGANVAWTRYGERRTASSAPHTHAQEESGSRYFWLLFAAVLLLATITRLTSLRDLEAGVGMDTYHHTLITALFVRDGGIPSGYEPYAPFASFTYHFGFHTLAAVVSWLTGSTGITDLMTMVPQVGQVAGSILPIPALTLFGWRVLGNRWLGLASAALAALVSVVPAYYIEWSRYTQGLGLAVLPVAWVLFVEAVGGREGVVLAQGRYRNRIVRVGPILLAAIAAAGLFLTHYRITVLYAAFAGLYILWAAFADARASGDSDDPALVRFGRHLLRYGLRAAPVAAIALIVVLPWLLNLSANFRKNFIDNTGLDINVYFAAGERLGRGVLGNVSLPLLAGLACVGLATLGWRLWHTRSGLALGMAAGLGAIGFAVYAWIAPSAAGLARSFERSFLGLSPITWFLLLEIAAISALLVGAAMRNQRDDTSRREAILLMPALVWLVLALWSSPQLLPNPLRLPLVGYLDAVTLTSSAWLPVCLLAGVGLLRLAEYSGRAFHAVRALPVVRPALVVIALLVGLAAAMSLAPIKERRPYIEEADKEALLWMRDNLPRDSYVLANSFNFPWTPTQKLGSDSGLWIPLVAGVRASVPPITTYNEKPGDAQYTVQVQELATVPRLQDGSIDWQAYKAHGITHVFIGSRSWGEGLDVVSLLRDGGVEMLYHRDDVWVFGVR